MERRTNTMSYEFIRHIDHQDNITEQDIADLRGGKVTLMIIDNADEHTMEKFGTLATQNQHTTEGRGFDVKGDKFFRVGSDDKKVPHVHLNENMPWHHDRGYTDPFPYVGLFCVEWEEGAPPTRFADMRKAYNLAPEALKQKADGVICVNSFRKYGTKAKYPVPFLSKAWEKVYARKAWKEHPLVMEDEYGKWFYFSESATECDFEDEMMEACFNENNIYDHYYKPNQLVAYNNLTTCHRRMPSPDGIRRRHLRYAAT